MFSFIFRGALDVGATTITTAMETAAVRALAGLAREEQSDVVASAYGIADVSFGPEYLIPKPFDPRLITRIAPAVAQAAMASGVATRPIDDIQAYRDQLQQFVYHSGIFMKPIFAIARCAGRWRQARIVFAEVMKSGCCARCSGAGCKKWQSRSAAACRLASDSSASVRMRRSDSSDQSIVRPRYRDYWETYHRLRRARLTQQSEDRTAPTADASRVMCLRRGRRHGADVRHDGPHLSISIMSLAGALAQVTRQ